MQLNTLSMVHEFLKQHVREGALCIDATAGKGRDTALLCRLAGESGRVIAFDIQQDAIEQTRALLDQQGLQAQLVLDSHAHMEQYAQAGTVDCVVFNFGRLPGGDPHIFTRAESSVQAIEAGLNLLKSGGVMAIALYYGKENGYEEQSAILDYLRRVDSKTYSVLCCEWRNRPSDPPMPIFIWKE
jgi:SAM-dependent methyltransferase